MPICTACGSVYLEADVEDHTCDPVRLPKAGEEIQQDGTKIDIKTKQKKEVN